MGEIELRRMQPSDVGAVAEIDRYAYLDAPVSVAVYGGNGEKERKAQEKSWFDLYANNPQDTYVAVIGGNIVGAIRSFPCSGDYFSSFPFSQEEHDFFTSRELEHLSFEERRRWWFMTWEKHDPATPHSHLGPFAVSPDFQRQGIGSKLLGDYTAKLDRAGIPSYLETTLPINVRIYQKFGYKMVDTGHALGFEHYFMWRNVHTV